MISQEGKQQGDSLGPLLFCLTLQTLLPSFSCELVIGYFDDVTIGGSLPAVSQDGEKIWDGGEDFGFYLITQKCELISLETSIHILFQYPILSNFIANRTSEGVAC